MIPLREEPINPYLKSRICSCEKFTYEKDFNWAQTFQKIDRPPTCAECGKWANRTHTCIHCRQQYYQFFQHPLMAMEASVQKFPWECWDCLETWSRWVITHVKGRKIPPPDVCVVPDREPQVMVHSDFYLDAMAKLRSISGTG